MKKPTFSKFSHWLLFLFDNYLQTNSFECFSSIKKELNSKGLFSQKKSSLSQSKFALGLLFLLFTFSSYSQIGKNFTTRLPGGSIKVKGDVILIGNTIVNKTDTAPKYSPSAGPQNGVPFTGTVTNLATLTAEANTPFNTSGDNNTYKIEYSNVDPAAGVFSSTSADLKINSSCKKIVFAGLYWSAIYPYERSTNTGAKYEGSTRIEDWKNVKLKLPGGSYQDITADEVIFDGYKFYGPTVGQSFKDSPYVCFKDVTSKLQALTDADGTYTVANVRAALGQRDGGGAGGWTLVVIYENPTMPSKYISVFDGYVGVNPDAGGIKQVDFPVSGFQTLPVGFPVNAKIGVGALEGDNLKTGDDFQFKASSLPATDPFTKISDAMNPVGNFFNATISDNGASLTNRVPNSTNTMGFDIDNVIIQNAKNKVIPNGETAGTLRLTTDGDGFGAFLTTFAVDIIEPKILLTKEVYDNSSPPVNMGNKDVNLGQQLNYVIGFQNQGNDNATSFTITDILPVNTNFVYPTDIVSLPPSITVKDPITNKNVTYNVTHTYNAATRTIVFTIPKVYVEEKDPRYEIRLRVQVVNSCSQLSDACTNIIQNTALSDYSGTYNTGKFGDKSLSSYTACNIGVPQSTNFLVDVDDCKFTKSEVLCGNSVDIKASNGYSSYKWSMTPFDNNGNTTGTIIGNSQTLTVTNPGVYYVYDTANAPCLSITEAVTVTRFGTIMSNPVIPFASEVVKCPNDGKLLPNIFLCGAGATKVIDTKISDGSTIVWEKLNEGSCTAVTNSNCANESTSCTWSQVGTGASYTANTSGQFRLTLNYPGGCFNRFYFNVYQNLLDPTETHRDIICNTKGNITIGGVPSGYEYSLDGTNYQASNSFTVNTVGSYTAYIRQIGITTNPCIFTIPKILIRQRNFTVSKEVTQPLCFGEKGSIKVAANDVEPQYYYKIFNGGTLVSSVGPISNGDYTFSNLTPGITYQVQVSTQDGCSNDQYIYINQPAGAIIATAALVEPLTACSDGKIVISAQGGNWAPYYYSINGGAFQTSNEIIVTAPGKYDIEVVDSKNCSTTTSITVPNNAKPTYRVNHTNSTCYGNGSQITIDNIVANGYSMSYSIDNGATFVTNPIFNNLYPGTYNVVVKYGITYTSQWNGQQTKYCTDTAIPVTITGPTSAVTASGGVGELAGCSTSATGEPLGLLRITNVEGGNGPYSFSFDGGNTWESSSEKYVPKGVYNLAVKDSNGCVFQIPYTVTLDPKPADPIIQDNINTLYNCDGTATATVIVDNPVTSGGTTYTYEYFMQKNQTGPIVPNSPISSNVFTNVPSGNHNVIVKYNVKTVSSFSNLLQEDFGRGDDTTSPGINSAYCWEKQDGNTLAFAACSLNDWHPWLMNDGDYVVTKGLLQDHFNDFNWWLPKDHTAVLNNTPGVTDGRFLAVNIGKTIPIGAVLYSKPINDVLPNQDINVTLYMTNLLKISNNLPSPQLRVQLVKNGAVIASQAMPDIPRDEKWHFSTDLAGALLTLNPGNNTSLDFQIISNSTVVNGNDLAIDDIHVYQIPKACGNERTFPIKIDGSKAFKASAPSFTNPKCSGDSNGTITIAAENFDAIAGYQYAVDGETTFHTTTVSPLVLTGFGTGSHTIIVRNDASGTCSYTLTQVITAPTAMVAAYSIVTQPTCTNGATIRASATGGSGVYQYELRTANGLTAIAGYEFSTLTDFVNVSAGTYTVVVKDSNNCISPASAPITITAPTPPTATLDTTSDLCYDAVNQATLVVKASGGSGNYSYKLDNQAAQSTNTFTKVGPGTHKIVVTDTNNCTAIIDNIIIAPALTAATPVVTGLLCDPATDATITIALSGGKLPYSYTVNGGSSTTLGATATSLVFSTSTANTYNFAISDASGCPTTATATVNAITNPTVNANPKQVSCNGNSDGEVTLVGSGGSGGYTYSFDGSGFSATTVYKGLKAGISYPYQVKDSKGCLGSGSITLTQPSTLTTSVSATKLSCNASNVKQTALITVAVPTTGTAPYQYSFNGSTPNGTNTFVVTDNGTDQTINIIVSDANGCTFNDQKIIKGLNPPTDLTFNANAITCSATTTTVTATAKVTSGSLVTPLKYEITSPTAFITNNTTGVFAGLTPNTYNFKVTDGNGCFYTESFEIKAVTPIAIAGNKVSDVLCNGGNTGNATFTVSGFSTSGNYDIVVTPAVAYTTASDIITLNNLAAGTYKVKVTDRTTGCSKEDSVTINQPTLLALSANATHVNCNDFKSQITGTASNGTPGYTYAAVKTNTTAPTVFAANPIIVDTNSGADLVWDVYAKDANGCTAKKTITIVLDAKPTVSAVFNNQCTAVSNNDFTIIATGNGGVAPLKYSIDGVSFQNSKTFSNLSPGTYTVTVKDANGCTGTSNTIKIEQKLTANAQVTKELDCSTNPQATITTTISGGKANYSYTVTKGTGTPSSPITGVAGPTFTYTVDVADADEYTFTITDANNCQTITKATVSPISNPTVSVASQVNVSCNGGSNGSVTLAGANGSGGYTYSKDNVTFVSNSTFTGLVASATPYTFYVKDSKDCTGKVDVTITAPNKVVANATATTLKCSTTNTKQSATITVSPTGGTGAYTYSYDNGLSFGPSNTLIVNDNGSLQSFKIIVKDANGCVSDMEPIDIAPLNPPVINLISATDITCKPTELTSTATISISGGAGTINYKMISPSIVDNGTNNAFTGLASGTYIFRVTDANGCYDTKSITINPVKQLAVVKQILSNVACYNGTTGSARFTVSNVVGTITPKIYNNSGTEIFPSVSTDATGFIITYSGLTAGDYKFIVTDNGTGCKATEDITITQPAVLDATYKTVNANCKVATSEVTVTTTGGTLPYKYSFVTSATTPGTYSISNVANLNPLTSLNWYAHIIDAKGCTFVLPITIASDPTPTVSASAINQCLGSGTYTITATNTTSPASGIVTPITYSIDNGASYQAGNTFTVTTTGDYVIKMKDGNGCIATSNTVTVNPQLTLSAVLDKDITCELGNEAAKITLTPKGGLAPYTFTTTGTGSFSGNVFTTNTAGSYTFTVKDNSGNSCSYTTTTPIVVSAKVDPKITGITQTQFIKCSGDATAAIKVNIDSSLGLAPFKYSLNGGPYQISDTFTGLIAGDYKITVKDAKECTNTFDYTITGKDPIVIDFDKKDIECVSGSTTISQGKIIINGVTGGTGLYNYYVTGLNGFYKALTGVNGSAIIDIVDFGFYQIRVTDANGCQETISNVKIASDPKDLDILVNTTANCAGGTADVKVLGTLASSGAFHFNIYTGPGQVFTADGSDGWQGESPAGSKGTKFTGLLPGVTYTFVVYDEATKCYYFEPAAVPIPTSSKLELDNFVENNVKCFSDTYGSVNFDIVNKYASPVTVTYQVYEAFTNKLIAGAGISVPVNIAAGGILPITDLGATALGVGSYYVLVNEVTGPNAGCNVVSADFNIKKSVSQLVVSATAIKTSNCNKLGVILAEATFGTGPYTYQVVPVGDAYSNSAWLTDPMFERAGTIAGVTYDVYAKDAYGCIVNVPVTVYSDEAPKIDTPSPICYDGSEFTITLSGTVDPDIIGAVSYSVNGSAFQADPNFTFNAAGTYNLVIKDGNDCTANVDFIVNPQLELKADLTKELDCTSTPAAEITLTASGGDPAASYTYEYSDNNGTSWLPTSGGNKHLTSAIGTYLFRVTDTKNTTLCQATTSITLDPIPVPDIETTPVSASCKNGSDGVITVKATGGVGPYTYKLLGATPANTTGDSTGIYTGLAAGNTYQVTVTDAKSCPTTSAAITVGEATAVSAISSITAPLECGSGNAPSKAVVTITASGGNGQYLYSYDLGVTYVESNVFETYAGTKFDVYIKDTNNCPYVLTDGVDVPALNPPTIASIVGTPIYCVKQGLGDITSTVTVTTTTGTGVGTLDYTILPSIPVGVTQVGNVFSGLTPGDYTFQVTDANKCTSEQLYTVKEVTNITLSGIVTKDVSCNQTPAVANGTAEFTVGNFSGKYSYTINAGGPITAQTATKISLTNLAIGDQEVIVTDETTGCTATYKVTVGQPAAALSVVPTLVKNANCNFGARVTAVAAGGTPNYTYAYGVKGGALPALGDYYTSADSVLDYGLGKDWTVYVKDANGCTTQTDFTIDIDPLPTIDSSVGKYCYDGSPVPITITGTYVGTPQYSIGNGYYTSPNFVLNAPGNYKFYIKDGNGCITSTNYSLKQELLLQATLTQDLTCDNDATITLLATQGTGPGTYIYQVSTDNGTSFSPISSTYTTNVPGDYIFRIKDGQACESILKTITVTPNTVSTFTTSEEHVSCPGGSDGSITVTAANGVAPYTYSINGGTFQTENYFTGLAAGTYTVVVKDAKGCPSLPVDVEIKQPKVLVASIDVTTPLSCGGSNAAQQAEVTVTVDPTTGTAPYQYSFDNGLHYSSNNVYKTFKPETVTALVIDANGCPYTGSILTKAVDALDPPVITGITGTDLWCSAGRTQSTVTISTSHGVGSLAFEILEPASAVGNTTGTSSGVFTGLAADTYLFRVTDDNGCIAEDYYTVKPLVNITASGQEVKAVACNSQANGTLEFKVANYTGGFTATLSPLAGTQTISGDTVTITGLAAGSYTLNISDSVTGCTTTANATVTQPTPLVLKPVSNINATCKTDAQVTVIAEGGSPTYMYAFKPLGQTPVASDYSTNAFAVLDKTIANWIAYVKDANNCPAQLAITIATDPLPAGFTAALTAKCPSATGTYDIKVTDGTGVGPFQYSIGSGFQTGNTFTVSTPGTYDITIKDANQCEVTFPAAVTVLETLILKTDITALPSCNVNNGSIDVSVTGGSGTGNYRFILDGGAIVSADSHTFSGLVPGSHTILVRDVVTLCEDSVTLNLIKATEITGFKLDKTDVSCNGGSNGTITATIDPSSAGVNDNPVYNYELTGTTIAGDPVFIAAQTSPAFTNLKAGDYTVKVISGRGCEDQEDITIKQPDVIVVPTPTVSPFGCTTASNSSNYATITVTGVTGGSQNYKIYNFFRNGVSVQESDSNIYTEVDYTGGSYTVTVTDDKGCSGSTTTAVTINPFIRLDKIDVTIDEAITCNNPEDITVKVATLGGTPAAGTIEYTVTGINGTAYTRPTNTTGIFKDLGVGFYSIAVKNTVTGCTTDIIHYVNAPNTFELQAVKTSDVKCFGSNEGEVELTLVDQIPTPTNEAGAFSYVVTGPNGTSPIVNSPDAGPLKLSGLKAGNYSVTATLTGSPYCSVSVPFTIVEPSAKLDITETHTDITCVPGNDGSIQATATGGWDAGYEYQLELGSSIISAWSSTTQFAGLSAGTYTVRVRDIKGCTDFVDVELKNPTPLAISVTPANSKVSCYGDKSATITATASFGQGSNYLYTLNYESLTPVVSSGPQGTGVFTGLGAGKYSVTVTDGWGCSATSTIVTIDEPAIVEASLVLSKSQTCAPLSAELTLSAKGGTAPYSYSATPNIASSIPMGAANSVTFPVGNGTFHYYVWDANGCASYISNDIQNDPLVPLTIDLDRQNAVVNCKGDLSGVIVAVAKGGLGNYVYTLLNSAGTAVSPAPTQSTPGRFDFLPAGTYSVKVDSGDCSKIEGPVTISEPATSLVPTVSIVPVTCNGNGDGKIIVTATGGTGIIKYAIEPNMNQFFETGTFENLKPGLYDVIVQDQNGCFELLKDLEIKEPTPIDAIVDPTSIVQEYCAGDKTGAFSVAISGGTAPYSAVLDDPKGTYVPVQDPTNVVFSGLEGGAHKVYIMDANTCTFELIVTLDKPVTLNPVASVNYDCVNDLPANKVTVTVDASNNPGDVVYSLDNSNTTQTSNVFTNLTPGDHFILAHHINTCIDATAVFTIDKIDPLAISIDLGGLNEIVATVTGGSGVYHYSVNGEDIGTNNKYIYYHTGDYTVTVTDSNGCSVSATKHFEFIDIEIPNVFTPNGNGTNDTWKPERTENYPDIQFVVYDRYGREVGKFGAGQGWDGKYKGNELPMGDYWYVLKLRNSKDDREFIGHFTLYR